MTSKWDVTLKDKDKHVVTVTADDMDVTGEGDIVFRNEGSKKIVQAFAVDAWHSVVKQ